MRLNLAFLTLLSVATVASGIELNEFELARQGDVLARAMAFGAAPVLMLAVALLVRIVSRIEDLRHIAREVNR